MSHQVLLEEPTLSTSFQVSNFEGRNHHYFEIPLTKKVLYFVSIICELIKKIVIKQESNLLVSKQCTSLGLALKGLELLSRGN